MVKLVHKAQMLIAQQTQVFLAHVFQRLTHQAHFAAARCVQAAHDVQQSRFATARCAHNAHALAWLHFQIQILNHIHFELAVLIGARHIVASQYQIITHSAKPPQVGCGRLPSLGTKWPRKPSTKKSRQ